MTFPPPLRIIAVSYDSRGLLNSVDVVHADTRELLPPMGRLQLVTWLTNQWSVVTVHGELTDDVVVLSKNGHVSRQIALLDETKPTTPFGEIPEKTTTRDDLGLPEA